MSSGYKLRSGATFDFAFRNAIRAAVGKKILGFDYSQQELRILAGEANETALMESFRKKEDPHTQTAALLFNIDPSEIGKKSSERFKGKTFNFSTIYGQGIKALAEAIGVTQNEAQKLQDKYFAIYRNIHAYVDKQIDYGKTNGAVYTKFGRKVTLWEYQSTNQVIYSKGDRLCVNGVVQGSAADFTKIAMVRSTNALREARLLETCTLIMNVHDALYYEIPEEDSVFKYIDVLQPAVIFPVPGWPDMEADWSVGPSWGEMKEINMESREEPSFEELQGADFNLGMSFAGFGPVESKVVRTFLPTSEGEVLEVQLVDGEVQHRATDGKEEFLFGGAILDPGPITVPAGTVVLPMSLLLSPQNPSEPPHTAPVATVDLGLFEAPQRLLLILPTMPTPEQGQRLVKLIGTGKNSLTLQTPDGKVPYSNVGMSIEMEQVVQMVVPGAELKLDADV